MTPEETFRASYVEIPETKCWEWRGSFMGAGYPQMYIHGTEGRRASTVYAHRWAYEHWFGEIPAGYRVRRTCGNKGCVNPKHMELELNPSKRTHCVHGHEFTEENTAYDAKGNRVCITCRRERALRWDQENRPRVGGHKRKTHCKRGHPLEGDNVITYKQNGKTVRTCRVCHRERNKAYQRAKKAA